MISAALQANSWPTNHRSIATVADEVARALAFAKTTGENATVVTPLTYPGGSRVVLSIREHANGYFISDAGRGAKEADLLGGSKLFPRIAREQAARNEIRFDSDLIFDVDVPWDALVTAAIIVANTSKTAVELTAYRIAERRNELQLEAFLGSLERAFGTHHVVRNAEIAGADSSWHVDALILRQTRPAALDLVTANANAVNATVTKFLDISRGPNPDALARYSVLLDRERTPHIGVLASTSRLVTVEQAIHALAA